MKKHPLRHLAKVLLTTGYSVIIFPILVSAAQVTLQWDANTPSPEGYRLYHRESGQSYDYNNPIWAGADTQCTVSLDSEQTCYLIVRAFEGANESGNSNEVVITFGQTPPVSDRDGDSIPDAADAFPDDPAEWIDTDQDGTGNNADEDDDNDGMPDSWEIEFGLDPLADDADGDLDNDGISNYDEYHNGSDPSQMPGNTVPEKPVADQPADGALVNLTPELTLEPYSDADGDQHARTRYQIATTADFSDLVLDFTSATHLTFVQVMDLILDPDTTYFWRARYIDEYNGSSDWSTVSSFTTIDYTAAGDANGNGIFDDQEVDGYVDLDNDGQSDPLQAGMLCLDTPDDVNPTISIKRNSSNFRIVAAKGYGGQTLNLCVDQPDGMTGLISFKLSLDEAVAAASVNVYFTEPASSDAKWYKYDPETGWSAYPHATFSPDRRHVTLLLEDGGSGDQDGVKNGVIVDPSGLGFSSSPESDGGATGGGGGGGGGGGCFITTINENSQSGTASYIASMHGIAVVLIITSAVIMLTLGRKLRF